MLRRLADFAQTTLTFCVLALAVARAIATFAHRHGIKPYSRLGWLREQELIVVALVAAAAGLRLSRQRTWHALPPLAISAAAVLAYGRYFTAGFAALFFIAALTTITLASSRVLRIGCVALLAGGINLAVSAPRRAVHKRPCVPQSFATSEFPAFKRATFISSGVWPKRYFGFFDESGDTANAESEMRAVVIGAVATINGYASKRSEQIQLTDLDVVTTFLAEGGARLLSQRDVDFDHVHPVRDVGLDDFAHGFGENAPLVDALDRQLGTHLGELVLLGTRARRPMSFDEAIAGTAVMVYWEKSLLARRLEGAPLATRSLPEQFVLTSLFYNTGQLFAPETVARIVRLDTADYLCEVNRANAGKRTLLPVLPPEEARQLIDAGGAYPEQRTSWNGAFHVLERYTTWLALRRFTDVFDERGQFRRRD